MENKKVPEKPITIKKGEDFSHNHEIIHLSKFEFGYGIWLFQLNKGGIPYFKGFYWDGLRDLLTQLGYYKRFSANKCYFIKESSNIIEVVEPIQIQEVIENYINEYTSPLSLEYNEINCSVTKEKLIETFLKQSHLHFNERFLSHLNTHKKNLLKDDKKNAYFFFKNCFVEVNKKVTKLNTYDKLNNKCIWRDHILDHNFTYLVNNKNCHFFKFLLNVTNHELDRLDSLKSGLGYLLHSYNHPSMGQAIILYDEEISNFKDPKGGTGKGLCVNGVKQCKRVYKVDGKKFDPNDKFCFQGLKITDQNLWIDDVKQKFNFDRLHSCLTDGFTVEDKFKDQTLIEPENSPKTVICSNSIISSSGSTNKRRQFPIEFSNHYSKHIITGTEEPIKNEHGCIFFSKDDWDEHEWNMFFSVMVDSLEYYMKNGLVSYELRSVNKNRLIQSTSDEFYTWVNEQKFEAGIRYEIQQYYEDFLNTYFDEADNFKRRGFTNWLKIFAETNNWDFKISKSNNQSFFTFEIKK